MRRTGRRVSAIAAVVLVSLSACSDDAPSVSAPEPVVDATTSAASTTSTVGTAAPGANWSPACRDTSSRTEGTAVAPAALARFGPLRATPSLTISLPRVPVDPRNRSGATGVEEPVLALPMLVDGGLVFLLNAGSSSSSTSGALVAVVDHGGRVRWTRCVAERLDAAWAAPGAERLLVHRSTFTDRARARFTWFAASDGRELGELAPPSGIDVEAMRDATPVASSASAVLLARRASGTDVPNLLVHVDLVTGAATRVPVTGTATARSSDGPVRPDCTGETYALDGDGRPVVHAGFADGGGALRTVWSEGAWRGPTATERLAAGVQIARSCGDDRLRAHSPDGSLLWRSGFTVAGLDGPLVAVGDDVVIAAACESPPTAAAPCTPATVALDLQTGRELWRSEQLRFLPAGIADGHVLASTRFTRAGAIDPLDGWELLDARTGAPVPGQRWDDPDAFVAACCGDAEQRHVERLGGLVVVTAGAEVRVWYPASVDVAPANLTLPPP